MNAFPLLLLTAAAAHATGGPFPPGPGISGTDAIGANDPAFTGWATAVESFTPGPQAAGTNNAPANYGTTASALGAPDAAGASYAAGTAAPVVSLGEGGQITLRFSSAIVDGEGADFAVFENGFATSSDSLFAELAFVEVSSDGANFSRFPAVSCTQTGTQIANLDSLAPVDLRNLAGKYPTGYGTPFDLAELGMTRVTHVRIVDVLGNVTAGGGSTDSLGNPINDPYPTNYQTSGFDLDAVGVIHAAPDAWAVWIAENFDASQRLDPAIAAPDADPDSDGKTNLVEYACGFLPAMPESSPALEIRRSASGIVLEYHRRADRDAIIALQTLTASGWQPVAGVSETGTPRSDVTGIVPIAAARGLFRLRITRP